MNVNEIADYIDMNCHECNDTPWSVELLFPSSFNSEESTNQNILQHSIDSKNHKQTKKRYIDCYKV